MRFVLPLVILILVCGCLDGQDMQKLTDRLKGTTTTTTTTTTLRIFLNDSANQSVAPEVKTVGEALFMWVPYECNYTNQLGLSDKSKTQIWMSEGKYQSRIVHGRFINHVINDGSYVYIWAEEGHGGMKYRISEITGLREHIESAEVKANRSVAIPTDYMDLLTAKNITCAITVLPDGIFDPPSRPPFSPGKGAYDYAYDSKLDKYGKNATI
jgi:hypothetical protein